MRSSRFFVLFGVLGVALAQACTDDDSPPAGGLPDAGGLDAQTSDSPVVTLPPQEASVADAAADGPVQGPVTVLVADEAKTPVAGVKVVFYDALGASTIEITGADGKAVHTMGTGGSVLVAEARAGGSKYLTSILGVEPFDTLDVAGGEPLDLSAPFATLSFATTDTAPFTGATSYEITAGCNSVAVVPVATPGLEMTVTPTCVVGGKVALLAIARNVGGDIVAYATKEVSSVTLNSTVAVPDIAAGDWVAATNGTFTITGTKPAHVTDGFVETSYIKNQQPFVDHGNTTVAATFTDLPFPKPPTGFADLFVSLASLSFADGPDGGAVSTLLPISKLVKQTAPPTTFPVGGTFADFLPRVHSAEVTGTGSPVIKWASDSAVTALGGFATFNGTIALDGDFEFVDWTAVFPVSASSTTVTLPALPAALADFQPTQTVAINSLGLVDSPELGSYKNFRAGFGPYTGLVYDVAYKLPPAPLTARVTGVRLQD